MPRCEACGHESGDGQSFCGECGARLPDPKRTADTEAVRIADSVFVRSPIDARRIDASTSIGAIHVNGGPGTVPQFCAVCGAALLISYRKCPECEAFVCEADFAPERRMCRRCVEREDRGLMVAPRGGDFTTIGEALSIAPPRSRISVKPGVYRESLTIDKPVEIIGDGPLNAIVVESREGPCVSISAEVATARGLTLCWTDGLDEAFEEEHSGVDVVWGTLLLEGCDIRSNVELCSCIGIRGGASATVQSCCIRGDTGINVAGISVEGGGTVTIQDCDISGCDEHGICLSGGADATVRNCRVHGTRRGAGVDIIYGRGTIEDCDIFANETGINMVKADSTVRDCRIHGNEGDGMVVFQSHSTVENCDISENDYGIVVRESTPMVSSCLIHDCAALGVDVEYGSDGTFEDCDIFGNAGGGIDITASSNPAVRGCRIHDSTSVGLRFYRGGRGTIEDCDIFGNAVGIDIGAGADPTVRGCRIHGRIWETVQCCERGRGTIEDCDISGGMSAVRIVEGADPTVRNCRIHESGLNGVEIKDDGRGTIEDCDIFGNGDGIAIEDWSTGTGSHPTVVSCTIHDNQYVGVRTGATARGIIDGCDLRGNGRGATDVGAGAQTVFRNCRMD